MQNVPKSNTTSPDILFRPGQVVATPAALEAMTANECLPLDLLCRHLVGDWGDISPEDAAANLDSAKNGGRILSSYALPDGVKLWIITEADRSVTTLLLPEEY